MSWMISGGNWRSISSDFGSGRGWINLQRIRLRLTVDGVSTCIDHLRLNAPSLRAWKMRYRMNENPANLQRDRSRAAPSDPASLSNVVR